MGSVQQKDMLGFERDELPHHPEPPPANASQSED
jgi:hypothetical protein